MGLPIAPGRVNRGTDVGSASLHRGRPYGSACPPPGDFRVRDELPGGRGRLSGHEDLPRAPARAGPGWHRHHRGRQTTAPQAATALGGLWLSSGPSAPWHTPGQPGVTVRAYTDLRRPPLTGRGSFDADAA